MQSLGAQKHAKIFGIKSDHTSIVKADGTTAATALSDALLTIGADSGNNLMTEVTLTPKDDGSFDVSLTTSNYDAATVSFKNTYFPPKKTAVSGAAPELKSVTGFVTGGTSASGNKECFLFVYGGSDGTNTLVNTYIVKWKNTSLAKSYKGDEWNLYKFEGTAVAALAAITIPLALFDDTLVTVAANQTHAKDYYEGEYLLPIAS